VTYDNWTVKQKPNCETTLTANTLDDKVYDYDASETGTVVWTYEEAFANTKRTGMPWSVCPITSCTVT
jgi:hypothetical protein